MPLSALTAAGVRLDATLPDLGCSRAWESIHRVRPRAELQCPACRAPVHPKLSKAPRRIRYFAHDAAKSDCPLTGESLDHRLLKVALAGAARAAGWHAELEVPGAGWRADVLATAPDGTRRCALEAQLSPITVDDIQRRAATMKEAGVDSLWITANNPPWLGHVPSLRIEPDVNEGFLVIGGLAVFDPDMCTDVNACEADIEWMTVIEGSWMGGALRKAGLTVGSGSAAGPCPGHGRWTAPRTQVGLARTVRAVLLGSCLLESARLTPATWREEAHGPLVWTTAVYRNQAAVEAAARQRRRAWELKREEAAARHAANTEALLDRQKAMIRPVVEDIFRRAGTMPWLKEENKRTPEWAMGVPVWVNKRPYAVICPVAARIKAAARIHPGVIVYAASSREADRLAAVCSSRQRIVVLEPDQPPATEEATA